MHFCPKDLNVVFKPDEYFTQKSFDRVQLRVGACCVSAQWARWPPCSEHFGCRVTGGNGLRPAEIMELVCSPRAALLAGVNSVNSRSFSSQTPSLLGQCSKSTRGGAAKMEDGCIMD